jgi:hypothetical protein
MSAKIAYVLFAGPEMPCKLQHAFLFARDVARAKGQARIIFEGNSPQWLPLLADTEHKLHKMYAMVKEQGLIVGVCKGCAAVHGVVDVVESEGLPLLDAAYGHASLLPYVDADYEIVTL